MGRSNIEYCDMVWNPVTGCTPISAGCDNCWAQAYLRRFGSPIGVTLLKSCLDEPLHWRKPQTVFVCSHGDLFHEDVPFEFIDRIGNMIGTVPEHTYLFLTKRPDRMLEYFDDHCVGELPSNVWLGVSVEDQKTADERIPILLQIPAAHHGVSIEPMLGPVDLVDTMNGKRYLGDFICHECEDHPGTFECQCCVFDTEVSQVQKGLDWVVVGCESGQNRRPFEEDWVRKVRDDCHVAGVRFMYKQGDQDGKVVKLPLLDGVLHDDRPGKGC